MSATDAAGKLRQVRLFRELSDAALLLLGGSVTTRHIAANEIIVRQDEPGEEMFLIDSGACVAFRATDGIEKELRRYEPGDYFGEIALISGGPRTASVRATTDMTLLLLHREPLFDLIRYSGDTALSICRGLAGYVEDGAR